MNLTKYFTILTLAPFSNNTESGRSKERYRLALLTALTSFLSKGVLMFSMFFSIRLSLPYLGVERFGIWMTIASLVAFLSFLDLGMGNALVNRVAMVASSKHQKYLSRCIGAGILTLFSISVLVTFSLYLAVIYFPWKSVLKISNESLYLETYLTIKIFAILFALNIFTSGINRIYFGLQKGYEANIATMFGSLLSLLLICTAIELRGGIPALLLASMLGGMLASFILLGILVLRKQVSIRQINKSIKIETPYLLKLGGGFFLLQLGTLAVYGADNLIIASSLGAVAVATYSVTQKLFQFVTQPFLVINSGLWPAYANAKGCGDKHFILKALLRSMIVTIVGTTILSLILLVSGTEIIAWWTNGEVSVSYLLMASFGLWAILDASASAFAIFMNGISLMRAQIGGIISLIMLGIPLKIYLASEFGIAPMLIGFSLFFAANISFWYGIIYRKTIRNAFL
jgi:O-antigen/teichoic acid export membrane protein